MFDPLSGPNSLPSRVQSLVLEGNVLSLGNDPTQAAVIAIPNRSESIDGALATGVMRGAAAL